MRILALDYGKKRTGVAVSDPQQIIAQALQTVETKDLFNFLADYLSQEQVEEIVLGHPKHSNNTDADIFEEIKKVGKKLDNKYPDIKISFWDERYTSKMAVGAMLEAGYKKKQRRKKENIDKMAAYIILRNYLDYKLNF